MERVDGRRQTFPSSSLKTSSFCIEEEVGYFWSHKHKQNAQTLKVQKRHILLPKHKPNGRNSMCKRNAFHCFWVETLLKSNIFPHVMHQQGSETLYFGETQNTFVQISHLIRAEETISPAYWLGFPWHLWQLTGKNNRFVIVWRLPEST